MIRRLVLAFSLLFAAHAVQAQETIFYKCTDAKGNVSMQNGVPCGPGMKQEVKRIGEVKTVPVPVKKAKVEEAPPEAPQYGEFVMVRGPSMKRAPAPEAAALGMGSACEMKYDTCTAITPEQLCDAWYRRLDDAEFKLKYASDDNRREKQAAFDGIDQKIKASSCSTVAPAVPESK